MIKVPFASFLEQRLVTHTYSPFIIVDRFKKFCLQYIDPTSAMLTISFQLNLMSIKYRQRFFF